jgi:hypothetical protein
MSEKQKYFESVGSVVYSIQEMGGTTTPFVRLTCNVALPKTPESQLCIPMDLVFRLCRDKVSEHFRAAFDQMIAPLEEEKL